LQVQKGGVQEADVEKAAKRTALPNPSGYAKILGISIGSGNTGLRDCICATQEADVSGIKAPPAHYIKEHIMVQRVVSFFLVNVKQMKRGVVVVSMLQDR
jgi:hypothetical protein